MGNSNSYENGEDPAAAAMADHMLDQFDGIETLGYRVLGVQPNSPASAAGLVSFFDFLVGANNQMLLGSGEGLEEGDEYDDVDFPALLEQFKGKPLELLVWNIKSQEQRLVEIIPGDDWGGAGLLGVTIRLDNYAGAEDRLIRILNVEHNSPASIAGLVTEQDYLLGTTTHSFDSTAVLATILEHHIDRVVELYVYNTNSDKVRVVALMPTWSWGGNGLLGAEVGTGYMHRLPSSCRGTLGGSVERRVRWIANSASTATAGGQDSGQQQPSSEGGGEQQIPGENEPTGGRLEVEPQLEMELSPHEEEEEAELHNGGSQQPTQEQQQQDQVQVPAETTTPPLEQRPTEDAAVKSSSSDGQVEQQQQAPSEQPQQTAEQPTSENSNQGAIAAAPAIAPQPTIPSSPSPAAVVASPGAPNEALDVFSSPPPGTSHRHQHALHQQQQDAAAATSNNAFLPPPPKMSYST